MPEPAWATLRELMGGSDSGRGWELVQEARAVESVLLYNFFAAHYCFCHILFFAQLSSSRGLQR